MTTDAKGRAKTKCFIVTYREVSVNYEDEVIFPIDRVFLLLNDAKRYCHDKALEIEREGLDALGDHFVEFKPITSQSGLYVRTYFIEQYDLFW